MSSESTTEKVLPVRVSIGSVEKSTDGLLCDGGVLAGSIQLSDDLIVAESGQPVSVLGIRSGRLPDKSGGALERASAGASVVLTLPQGVPVSPGALLVSPDDRPEVADQFAAFLDWVGSEPMLPGRKYRLRLGSRSVLATVTEIKYRLEPGSGDQLAAKTLNAGATAFCNFSLSEPIAFDRHEHVPETATFSLSAVKEKDLLGTGRVAFGLRRATNVHWQAIDVNKGERGKLKRHKPAILWFTGLSGSGKSTVANLVERALHSRGYHTYVLDGDNVRHGLNRDLGFSDADRVENIRRVAEVSKLFVDAGMLVVVAFISPFRAERKLARDLVEDGEFFEVFVDTPIDECRKRDPKGLYARADRGEIKNFTGVDSPYEAPEAPEIHLRTMGRSPPELAEGVLAVLAQRGVIPEA